MQPGFMILNLVALKQNACMRGGRLLAARKIAVKSILTGRRYSVFPEWHCYNSEQIAIQAAEKYKEGYVDMIY